MKTRLLIFAAVLCMISQQAWAGKGGLNGEIIPEIPGSFMPFFITGLVGLVFSIRFLRKK